jgi:hypothetical protein
VPEDRVLYTATIADPLRDTEKMQAMYESLAEARRQSQQDTAPVPFHKFVDMVRQQMGALKEKGSGDVAFRVAMKDGKPVLTARPMRASSSSEE